MFKNLANTVVASFCLLFVLIGTSMAQGGDTLVAAANPIYLSASQLSKKLAGKTLSWESPSRHETMTQHFFPDGTFRGSIGFTGAWGGVWRIKKPNLICHDTRTGRGERCRRIRVSADGQIFIFSPRIGGEIIGTIK